MHQERPVTEKKTASAIAPTSTSASIAATSATAPTLEKLREQIKNCRELAESLHQEILPYLQPYQYYLPATEEIDEKRFTSFISQLYEEKSSCLNRENSLFYKQLNELIDQYIINIVSQHMISPKMKGTFAEHILLEQYKLLLTKFIKRLQDPKDLGSREPKYYQDIKNALEKAFFYLCHIRVSSQVYVKFKLIMNAIEVCGPGVNTRLQDLVYEMQLKRSVYDWLGECRKNLWQQIEDQYSAEHKIPAGETVHVHNHFLLISRKYQLNIPTAEAITQTADEYIRFSHIHPEHEESLVFEFKQLYAEETMVENSVTNFLDMKPKSETLSEEQRDSFQTNIKILTDAHIVSISDILVQDEGTYQVSLNPRFIQDLPRYSKALLRAKHIISMYSDAIAFLKEQEESLGKMTDETALNEEQRNKLSKKLAALQHLLYIRRFNVYETQLQKIFKNPELLPILVIREEIDRMLSASLAVAFSFGEFTCPDLQILEAIYKLDKILIRMGLLLKDSQTGHPDFDAAREKLIEAAVAAYTSPDKTYEKNIAPFEASLNTFEKLLAETLHRAIKQGSTVAKQYTKKESNFILQMSPAAQQQLVVAAIEADYYQLLLNFYEMEVGPFSKTKGKIESLSPYYLNKQYRHFEECMTAAVMMMLQIPFPAKNYPLPKNLTRTSYHSLQADAKKFHTRVIHNFFWTAKDEELHKFIMTFGLQVLFYICEHGLIKCFEYFNKFHYPDPKFDFPNFSMEKSPKEEEAEEEEEEEEEAEAEAEETDAETNPISKEEKVNRTYSRVWGLPVFKKEKIKRAIELLEAAPGLEILKRKPNDYQYRNLYDINMQRQDSQDSLFDLRKTAQPFIYLRHFKDESGVTALHIAAQYGQLRIVQQLAVVQQVTYTSSNLSCTEWQNPTIHPLVQTTGVSDIPPETAAAYAKRQGDETPEVKAVITFLTRITGEKLQAESAPAPVSVAPALPQADIKKSVTAMIQAKKQKDAKVKETSEYRMVFTLLNNCKSGQLQKLITKTTFSRPFAKLTLEDLSSIREKLMKNCEKEDERIQYLDKEILDRQPTVTMRASG